MSDKSCYVCNGTEPKVFAYRCEKHDVCLTCGKKRKDLKEVPWGARGGFKCKPCETARIEQRIADFQSEEHGEYDFIQNDEVFCPYCGYKYCPDNPGDCDGETDCPECEKMIVIETHFEVMYSTTKKP